MKQTVIALYNNYLDCYDLPQFVNTPTEELPELYRRSIYSNPDNAFDAHVADKTLCILGEFDDCKGQFVLLENPKKLVDLASCFPAGYLAKRRGNNA